MNIIKIVYKRKNRKVFFAKNVYAIGRYFLVIQFYFRLIIWNEVITQQVFLENPCLFDQCDIFTYLNLLNLNRIVQCFSNLVPCTR